MIVGSLLLILVAATLLVIGLATGSSGLLIASIAASLLAAVALVVGARQAAAARVEADYANDEFEPRPGEEDDHQPQQRPRMSGARSFAPPRQRAAVAGDDEDPTDEPAPQAVSAPDAARVARMVSDVLVVDGRPRYHLPGCGHLVGRQSEPLPVGEAVELGFTPCGRCEPDRALLADARRV